MITRQKPPMLRAMMAPLLSAMLDVVGVLDSVGCMGVCAVVGLLLAVVVESALDSFGVFVLISTSRPLDAVCRGSCAWSCWLVVGSSVVLALITIDVEPCTSLSILRSSPSTGTTGDVEGFES